MAGAHRRARRRRRGSRPLLLALTALLVLLVAPASLGAASATSSAATGNRGDRWTTDQVAPPTGLTAAQACTSPSVITFRGSTTAHGADAATAAVPAGTVAGDVLFAQAVHAVPTVTASSPGWTLVDSHDVPG